MKRSHVPSSLDAKTKKELIEKMRKKNLEHGRMLHYFDFSYANGLWHCWYEIKEDKNIG